MMRNGAFHYAVACSEYEAKIRFLGVTSAGPFETTETSLNIMKNKYIWCVKEAK